MLIRHWSFKQLARVFLWLACFPDTIWWAFTSACSPTSCSFVGCPTSLTELQINNHWQVKWGDKPALGEMLQHQLWSISESLWNQGQGEADTEVSCDMCPWKWNSANYYIWEIMVCVQVFWESSLASSTLHRNEPQVPLCECRGFIGTAERYIYRPALHFNANELFHWY